MIIRARAPLRLGLAGGGTDVSPYPELYGGCVLNATIDRYAYTTIKPLTEDFVEFVSLDRGIRERIDIDEISDSQCKLALHRAAYLEIIDKYCSGKKTPLSMSTYCDAPMGSGLGASSTIVVSMISALADYFNLALSDYDVASISYVVERERCGFAGGQQDQYSASFGGVNYIEFFGDRVVVNSLRVKQWILSEFESSLLLFYSGVSRESANIINDQKKNLHANREKSIGAMHAIKSEAAQMKECLLKGDLGGVIESMRAGWESKKLTARSVTNSYLDSIYEAAIEEGARAGKVSGAGGGGFFIFYVPHEYRAAVTSKLEKFGGITSGVHFSRNGRQSWQLNEI